MFGLYSQGNFETTAAVRGTQAVDRALALLHEIATDSGQGRRLSDLANRTGLDRATARRLVRALMRRGFVEQDNWTRKYYLGMQFFSVAAAASNRLDLDATACEALERLRAETGSGGTFMRFEGCDLITIGSIGSVRAGTGAAFDRNARLPVGANAYGVAILSALAATEAEDLVIGNINRLAGPAELTVRLIQSSLVAARRAGHAMMRDPATGIVSLAIALRTPAGVPVAALGLDGLPAHAGAYAPASATLASLTRGARALEEALRRLA